VTHVRNLNQAEHVTVFLTTHYMDEADRVADRIAVIDHGRIVAMVRPESSSSTPAPIRSKRPSSRSPARRFATRAPRPPISCGKCPRLEAIVA